MVGGNLPATLREGLEAGWFTGCQAAFLSRRGTETFAMGAEASAPGSSPVTEKTLFDLASLTKSLLAAALAPLVAAGSLRLQERVGRMAPALARSPLGSLTCAELLGHRSGLPPFLPWEHAFAPAEDPGVRARIARGEGRAFARERILELVPEAERGVVYSDIGYHLVQLLLEEGLNIKLEELISTGELTRDAALRYLPVGAAGPGRVAATGPCPWRGRELRGEVNDPRAYLMGGVAAWAGLFGTASGLACVAERMLGILSGSGAAGEGLRTLVSGDASTRAGGFGYGFMRPTPGASLGGGLVPPGAFGHLGFTGTSWWIDPSEGRAAVVLTNLALPPGGRDAFNRWRIRLHDLFWKET